MTKEEYDKLIEEKRSFIRFEEEKEPDFESDQEAGLPMPPLFKEPSGGEEIPLPKNFEDLPIKTDFLDIINSRRSERVYTKEPISLLELSYIIWCAQGVEENRGDGYMTMRTVPSGGGRHGFELYFAAMRVDGLIPGIYHYLPQSDSVELIKEFSDTKEVVVSALDQKWVAKAPVMLYLTLIPSRNEWRYGPFAHRVALIDAGHVGQNIYLACTSIGLGTCGIAAFDNAACSKLLNIDLNEEFVVYCGPCGHVRGK